MDTPLRSGLWLVLCLLASASIDARAAEQSAPLALEAQVGGTWIKVLAFDQRRLVGQDASGEREIPATAPLRLVGDLVANPGLVEAAVAFNLTEVPSPSESDRPIGWRAEGIRPVNSLLSGPQSRWRATNPGKAVFICIWQVDGKPVRLRARPAQTDYSDRFTAGRVSLDLAADEASGNPVFLLLENGEPLPKETAPADAAADRLGVLLALGQDGAVAAELRRDARVPATSKGAPTLLHLAAQTGAIQTVNTLLELHASTAAKADSGDTPLHSAVRAARSTVVERLLAAKASTGAANDDRSTPLHLAAIGAHAEICRLLVEARASINTPDKLGQVPVILALLSNCAPAVDLLLAHKARFELLDADRDRLLVPKAAAGQRRLVQLLLAEHADPNAGWRKQTALFVAAREGHAGIVADLLAAKADPNQLGPNEETPLLAAAGRGHAAVVRLLLAAGANAIAANRGFAPIHAASFAGSAPTIQALLSAGVPADSATASGVKPLTLALGSGSRECVETLLAAGATVDLASPRFDSELTAALAMDSDVFIAAALKAGMPVDQQTAKGWPALRLAAISKAERCATLLRNAGAADESTDAAITIRPSAELEKRPTLVELRPIFDPRDPEEGDLATTTVTVEAIIGLDGAPAFARATCKDCRLSRSAVETVLGSRFQPAIKDGMPVATKIRIPIQFEKRAEEAIEFARLDVKPKLIDSPAPIYPFALKQQGITGEAVVQFIVTEDGAVHDVIVVNATHEGFADSAAAAIRRWRFEPGVFNGRAVATRMQQSFPFRLN
ncbi:MAG TPA: TonB family protein [Opitutaceae bacterium]|nr:TonB family protein [Opitutaceae bacterium]